jgi:hypothetical protein
LNSARSDSVDRFYAFLEPGQLIDAPEETPYARHWQAARADSFKPAVEIR